MASRVELDMSYCIPDEMEPQFEIVTLDDISKMHDRLRAKRHSRVWFDPDVRLLNALVEAEEALDQVAKYLVIEGMELNARLG